MTKIFDSALELVRNVTDGDDRQPFLVVHRNVEFYVLADDEDSALAEVFREKSKAQAGALPADVLISATRQLCAEASEAASAVDNKPAEPKTEEPKTEPAEPKSSTAAASDAKNGSKATGKGKTTAKTTARAK